MMIASVQSSQGLEYMESVVFQNSWEGKVEAIKRICYIFHCCIDNGNMPMYIHKCVPVCPECGINVGPTEYSDNNA